MLGSTDVGEDQHRLMSHIGKNVKIGKDCRIQGSVYMQTAVLLKNAIGREQQSPMIDTHHQDNGAIIVEDDVIIGANATITGIILNKGCVIRLEQ